MTAVTFAHRIQRQGVRRVLYTDIARDGMMKGPNMQGLRKLVAHTSLEVIMSGGVTTLDDLRRLAALAVQSVVGVIVGRALYEGAFTLAEAIAVTA